MKAIVFLSHMTLGLIYATDIGVCKKINAFEYPDTYVSCLRPFFDQGNTEAIKLMGEHYYIGKNKDYKKAVEFYTLIAKTDPESAASLGAIYVFGGYGIEKDEKKSFYWYEKAMQGNNLTGKVNVASAYLHGRGVNQDCPKALSIFENLASKNFWPAQDFLGHMYFEGRCVNKDIDKAKFWIQKSYNNGGIYQAQYFWNKQNWGSI